MSGRPTMTIQVCPNIGKYSPITVSQMGFGGVVYIYIFETTSYLGVQLWNEKNT
jgi:hypothetical protein